MKPIPRTYKAVDGISGNLPGRAIGNYIDWETLRREFITNADYPRPRTWLMKVKGWSRKRIAAGNTQEHITGWGALRADFQQKLTEQSLADVLAEERRLLPKIRRAKLTLVLAAIQSAGSWRTLEPAEQRTLYQIIKTELGEPVSIKVQGLISAKDPVEALLEEYGLMQDGVIIDDDEDEEDLPPRQIQEGELVDDQHQTDSAAVETADSSAPSEVPQG